MFRGKVTQVDARGVYVQTAEYGVLGPCQAVAGTWRPNDMVLCAPVGDPAAPDLVVVGGLTDGLGQKQLSGTGSPEGAVTAPVGSVWTQTNHTDLGWCRWYKNTGSGNTGWLPDFEGRWVTFSPTWYGVSMSATVAAYTRSGNTVHFTIGGTLSAAPTGSVTVDSPTQVGSSAAFGLARLSRSSSYQGVWLYNSSSSFLVRYVNPADNAWQNLSATLPAAWASGDIIMLAGTYQM